MANGQTFSGGGLAPRPPSSVQTDDVKRQQQEFQQMARDAGEAFQSLVIARDNQIRGGGAPGRFFVLLEDQFVEAARVWKEALRAAGKDTAVVDRSLARARDGTPKVPITRISQKPGQKDTFVDPTGQQVAPAIQNPQRFRPNAPVPVGPQEFLGTSAGPVPGTFNPAQKPVQQKIRAVFDNQTSKPTFASESQILANPDRFGPIPTGTRLRVGKDGAVEIATGGQDLTPASTTAGQKILRQTKEVLANTATLKRLFEKSKTPIVGGLAAFRGFLNKTAVQFVPGLFDRDRAKFERATKAVRQTALRVVSDETRFSESDRDFVFDLFPSPGIFESEEEAAVKMNVLIAFFGRRFSNALTDLGLDQASIPQIKPEDIRDAMKSGFLGEEEAGKILRQLFPEQFSRD